VIVSTPDPDGRDVLCSTVRRDATGTAAPTYSLIASPRDDDQRDDGAHRVTPSATGERAVSVRAFKHGGRGHAELRDRSHPSGRAGINNSRHMRLSGSNLTRTTLHMRYDLAVGDDPWHGVYTCPSTRIGARSAHAALSPDGGGRRHARRPFGSGFNAIAHGNPVWVSNGARRQGMEFDGTGMTERRRAFPDQCVLHEDRVCTGREAARTAQHVISVTKHGGHALWAPTVSNKLSAGHNYHWNIVQDTSAGA